MSIAILFVLLVLASSLGACSYQATAPVSASYDVYSSYDDKVPGKFALYVESGRAAGVYKVDGLTCSAHDYPLEARSAVKSSVLSTFKNLVQEIELVDVPLSREDMSLKGIAAQIHVEIEDMEARLSVIPGFWSAQMMGEVEITASLKIDGRNGRLLGTTVEAGEYAKSDSGTACDGGAKALSMAASKAIEELMQRLGERLSNSSELRRAKDSKS